MAMIADYIFDLALEELNANSGTLHLCSGEPANFGAVGGVQLGTKIFNAGSVGAPEDRAASNGRKVVVAAFSDGTVSATGTATHWAITKGGTTLMATGALASSQGVTSGNTFSLAAFDIGFPDAV